MGASISLPVISLIVLTVLIIGYIIGVSVYASQKSTETPTPTPPSFTPAPSTPPAFTPSPTSSPIPSPTITPSPTPSPAPHLEFNSDALAGPPNAPSNFYRLGCRAALSEGLFPFSNFNTTGTYHSGTTCNYYTYDTWGFGGDYSQVGCGSTCLPPTEGIGIKGSCTDTSPPPSPNQPWTDEQCDICATASKDPNCIWTQYTDSCYTTISRVDYVNGKWVDNNVTFVPTYHGMDISQCYYRPQGLNNDHKLCCDPSVA